MIDEKVRTVAGKAEAEGNIDMSGMREQA